MRAATMAEWTAMIARLRERGAPADLVAKLASGAIGTFHTETGEMLTAPPELAGGKAAPARSRGYGDLSFAERHELATTDPTRLARVREEWNRWNGKTYGECSAEELLDCWKKDRPRFERMLERELIERRKAG